MANAGTTAGPLPQPSDTPRIEQLAPLFPQLELIELIGRGGMGFVFKARQLHLDREVALKLLSAPLGLDAHFADRFTREARVLARLNHPNIVMVHDFGSAGGYHYLIMEYVDGLNLRQAMRMGKFSPAEALSIVPRICDALQYAHEEGVLHRDIKPENLLLDSRGRVKIADFGIAKIVREDHAAATLTGTGATLGTPHYMAPEQFENPAEVDHRADIYSLGVVFYEMLTGELPIGRFQAPSSRTELDERVDAIVLRALARERELRQKDARELQTEVEQVRATPGVAARAEAVQGTRSPKGVSLWGRVGLIRRRSVWTKVATAALLVLFGFFLAVKMMPRRYYLGPETADDLRSQVEVLSDGPGENPPPLFLTNSPVALDETAKRQEGEIRDARERYEAAKERHSKGEISSRDLALADRDLAVAEARGDEIKSALAQYRFAEWDFRDASLAQETDRIRKAETEMNKAQYALELARAGSNELDRKLAELKHAERAWGSAQRWKARGDISEDEARKLQNNYFYAELEYKRMRENLQNQADRKF